jgi:hypothetical protein
MVTKLLVSAAIVLGAVAGAAPARADDPGQSGGDSNPFAALTAPAPRNAPANPAMRQELDRGIRAGLAG